MIIEQLQKLEIFYYSVYHISAPQSCYYTKFELESSFTKVKAQSSEYDSPRNAASVFNSKSLLAMCN
jgi:hypothetical protein